MCAYPLLPARPCDVSEAAARPADWFLLDARDAAAFAAGHLRGAGRITVEEFAARRAELPPREATVLVVHTSAESAQAAAEALALLNYRAVRWLAAPLAALPGGLADRSAAEPLWRPSPFLSRITSGITSRSASGDGAGLAPAPGAGRALDVACGSSREGVHLALRGWHVEAWDHDPVAIGRASEFARRHGVTLETRVVDLENGPVPAPGEGWDLVMVFRFLHRPLFGWLAEAVRPGGSLVYETFRVGQEVFGHPKQPRFLLTPGELANVFPDWRVEDHEETAPEGGPYMSRWWLRRPAATS